MDKRDLGRRFTYEYATAHGWPAKRPKTVRCKQCGRRIVVKPKGRLPSYCSQAHRQRAYEMNKYRQPSLVRLYEDLGSVKMRAAIRQELFLMLQQLGLPVGSDPPPMPEPKRPSLRVVKPHEGTVVSGSLPNPSKA